MSEQKPKSGWDKEAFQKLLRESREETIRNQKILEQVRETQRKAEETKKNLENTLSGLRETIVSISTTTDKIKKFQEEYNNVLDQLASRVVSEFSQQNQNTNIKAEVLPVDQILQNIMKYNRFVFVTGAGISAPSGIPTFRGKGGYWTSYLSGGQLQAVYEAKKMLTSHFYNKYPSTVWKWHKQFQQLCSKCEPNEGHILLDKICTYLVEKGKQVTLVTQNLDNLQPINPKYPLHHIHGDIKYIRCEGTEMHLSPFSLDQIDCSECENKMRPHTLFFDEAYQHHYGGAVMNLQFDVLFSIGTMLETNLARRLTSKAKEVVQINPEPVLKYGKVYTMPTNAIEALSQIYNQLSK